MRLKDMQSPLRFLDAPSISFFYMNDFLYMFMFSLLKAASELFHLFFNST